MSEFHLGSTSILYINSLPVGCLTSQTLSETIQFMRTGKTTQNGAIKSLPTLYGYSIPFECVMIKNLAKMDYWEIQALARERRRIEWDIVNSETGDNDYGDAFIENLQLTASVSDFIKFTGTLTGYGAIG